MATYSELVLPQRADFLYNLSPVKDSSGYTMNLYGYSVKSQLRKSPYSQTYFEFVSTVSNYANGIVSLAMSSANTSNITPGRYLYDVVIKSPSNTITRIVEGIVNVTPGITIEG
jgi:hypothetical protein